MADDAGGGGKAQAVREVCAASAAFSGCPHRRRSPRRPPFVDWYLVLAVPDAAPVDAVRRRFRQLALLLHPDKNTHAKAEVAFKIVSEAHACLTDKARRRAFDDERAASYCAACHDRFRSSSSSTLSATPARQRAERRRTPPATPTTTTGNPHSKHRGGVGGGVRRTQALREVQNRLREECRVIDGCLRANNDAAAAAAGGGARRRQSFPLFDPSDRRLFPGYPHTRPSPPFAGSFSAAEFRRFGEDLGADQSPRWCRGVAGGGGESPVYQIRTAPERATRTKRPWIISIKSEAFCIRSYCIVQAVDSVSNAIQNLEISKCYMSE
uniref:J domain-containing protein n=1 Tax=Leersia perrieri TaxID=77586 RepID=A0A0D9W0Z9_9ORYZ